MVREHQVKGCHLRSNLGRVGGLPQRRFQLANPRQRLREIRPTKSSSSVFRAAGTNSGVSFTRRMLFLASPKLMFSRPFIFCGRFPRVARRPFTVLSVLLLLVLLVLLVILSLVLLLLWLVVLVLLVLVLVLVLSG